MAASENQLQEEKLLLGPPENHVHATGNNCTCGLYSSDSALLLCSEIRSISPHKNISSFALRSFGHLEIAMENIGDDQICTH